MKKTLFIILLNHFLLTTAWAQTLPDISRLQTQAMQGDVLAQYQLAQYYQQQDNDSQAETWFEQAAQQGYAPAQTKFAWHRYAAQDYDTAAHYYAAAAEQNEAEAQFNMGLLYERGDGVDADAATALSWYKKAAAQKHAPAQTRLGWLAEHGVLMAKNEVQAAQFYEKAAKWGYADAQFNLAALLDEQGKYAAAALWYERAGKQNHAKSLYNLAILYQDGKGVSKNQTKVHELLKQATYLGLPEAEAALAE